MDWVHEGRRIKRYDEKADRFEMLETIHMFSDNAIYSIVEDNHCNLWLATRVRFGLHESGSGRLCQALHTK